MLILTLRHLHGEGPRGAGRGLRARRHLTGQPWRMIRAGGCPSRRPRTTPSQGHPRLGEEPAARDTMTSRGSVEFGVTPAMSGTLCSRKFVGAVVSSPRSVEG